MKPVASGTPAQGWMTHRYAGRLNHDIYYMHAALQLLAVRYVQPADS
jgi:hypothetical protein